MGDMMRKLALPLYLFVSVIYFYTLKGQRNFQNTKTSEFHMFKEMKMFANFYFTGWTFGVFSYNATAEMSEKFKVLLSFRRYFFTMWTFTLHLIFVITAILDETSKILSLPVAIQKRLGRTRAFIFNTLLFPCCLLVASFFWGVWHIDRELIFPKALDEFFPTWLNHALHTFPLIPMAIELLLPKKHNFVQFRQAAPILLIYSITYTLLFLSVYIRHGIWIYPVFKFLTWTQRVLLFISIMSLELLFQKIGIIIQNSKRLEKTAKIK